MDERPQVCVVSHCGGVPDTTISARFVRNLGAQDTEQCGDLYIGSSAAQQRCCLGSPGRVDKAAVPLSGLVKPYGTAIVPA
jgi:hypothetical protein